MIGLTLTGADERTPIAELIRLADAGVEIGILYTHSPDGRNRYPSWDWIEAAVATLGSRAAIHVCGARAREEGVGGFLSRVLERVGRIQVNGYVSVYALPAYCASQSKHTIITQHTERNAGLALLDVHHHSLLVDASGGRGILPGKWERPVTPKAVGFAGGLTPENLAAELPKIAAAAGGAAGTWVDMESGLRTDDWFDVAKAWECVRIVREFNEKVGRQ